MENLRRVAAAVEMDQRFCHRETALRQLSVREVLKVHERSPADALQVVLERWAEAERAASSQTSRAPAADEARSGFQLGVMGRGFEVRPVAFSAWCVC